MNISGNIKDWGLEENGLYLALQSSFDRAGGHIAVNVGDRRFPSFPEFAVKNREEYDFSTKATLTEKNAPSIKHIVDPMWTGLELETDINHPENEASVENGEWSTSLRTILEEDMTEKRQYSNLSMYSNEFDNVDEKIRENMAQVDEELEELNIEYHKTRLGDIFDQWEEITDGNENTEEFNSKIGNWTDKRFSWHEAPDSIAGLLNEKTGESYLEENMVGSDELASEAIRQLRAVNDPETLLNYENLSQGGGELVPLALSKIDQHPKNLYNELEERVQTGEIKPEGAEITSTWKDNGDNLMGYDAEEEKPVKLIDSDNIKKARELNDKGKSINSYLEGLKQHYGEGEYIQRMISSGLSMEGENREWFLNEYLEEFIEEEVNDHSSLREANTAVIGKLYEEAVDSTYMEERNTISFPYE
ncbi:MAG: hypothetical protein BRC29_05355 [Nanohaloarchaea archaeon SW_7_43_1]|nr:MAG: hypothetical protein BRC29_05355 [Nanohaloarchaea archaeon SW_7_43_1]